MCSCDTADMPEVFDSMWRKARKPHRCVECSRGIKPGDRYEYASGIWDGEPDSYKTCARCVRLRKAHIAADLAVQRDEIAKVAATRPVYWPQEQPQRCSPIFGELLSQIGECAREDRRYLARFRENLKLVQAE